MARSFSDERLFTREQAADFLNVSPRTIDAWCANHRGELHERKLERAGAMEVHAAHGHAALLVDELRRLRVEGCGETMAGEGRKEQRIVFMVGETGALREKSTAELPHGPAPRLVI